MGDSQRNRTKNRRGYTVLLDRYFPSGISYSAAKGLDYEWCCWPDREFWCQTLSSIWTYSYRLSQRKNYGDDINDNIELQRKVECIFQRQQEEAEVPWIVVDASVSQEDVLRKVLSCLLIN